MQRVIIAGTFVPQWLADRFYEPMAKALSAKVVALAGLGLDHPTSSMVNVGMYFNNNKPVQLIGHSQGGLVAALCNGIYNVDKLVTLGAPLKGLAFPIPPGFDWPAIKYMHSSNPSLKNLKGASNMLTVSSKQDFIVPERVAHLEGSNHVYLEKPMHSLLPRDKNVIRIVKEFLDGGIQS